VTSSPKGPPTAAPLAPRSRSQTSTGIRPPRPALLPTAAAARCCRLPPGRRHRALTQRAGRGGRLRRDAYGAFVSCDGADASHLIGRLIGFSDGAAQSYKRVLELQILLGGRAAGGKGVGGKARSPLTPKAAKPDASAEGGAAGGGGAGGENAGDGKRRWAGADRSERHVMSVVVEDARRRLQLFTKGDAEAVLDNCSQVWDGQELRPMTSQDRALIMQHHNECVQKHYKCVALSYVSLPDSVRPTIASSAQLGRTLFLDRRGGGDLHMAGAADWAEEGPREAPGPNASGSPRPCRP
jgi:hypothetical protein